MVSLSSFRLGLLFLCVLCGARVSGAEPAGKVVLIDPPQLLVPATKVALAPWGIGVARAPGPVPDPSMPHSSDRARDFAAEHGARAVVWISSDAHGPALWTYDRKSDRVVVRRLSPGPPTDEASAAAVALTIKTLLRHSMAAPVQERFGSRAPSPPFAAAWHFEAQLSWRHTGGNADSEQARLGVGASRGGADWRVAAHLRMGTGLDVVGPGFSGAFSAVTASLELRRPWQLGPLTLGPSAGLSAHVHRIEGALRSGAEVSASRFNPSFELGGFALWWPDAAIGVGARLESSAYLRRQRYLVRGRPVLELPRADWEGGVWMVVPIR